MGALCSTGFGSSGSVRVDCPLEFVWETIADLQHYPDFLSHVSSVHCLNKEKMKILKRGTRWRETRIFQGEPFVLLNTVTSIEDQDKNSRLVRIHSGFTESYPRTKDLEQTVHTSTLVVTRTGPEECELRRSYAIVYGTWIGRLVVGCCQWYLPKVVETSFEEGLKEFANEAVSRYQQSRGNKRSCEDIDCTKEY
jgi:hypothetical protein